MRHILFAATLLYLALPSPALGDHIWFNEIHYDNPGADTGEFIEVGIRNPNGSGFAASDYAVEFYNGLNGDLYGTTGTLNTAPTIGTFPIAGSADMVTLYSFPFAGIQNGIPAGTPDGFALVNVTNGSVASFLSYEGAFSADADNGGIAGAAGAFSIDVGVSEPGVGILSSLSAMGNGVGADQFDAGSFALTEVQTPGTPNTGQVFTAVPEPSSFLFLGLLGLVATGTRYLKRS